MPTCWSCYDFQTELPLCDFPSDDGLLRCTAPRAHIGQHSYCLPDAHEAELWDCPVCQHGEMTCQSRQPVKPSWYCTLPKDHDGPHRGCGDDGHAAHTWINDKKDKQAKAKWPCDYCATTVGRLHTAEGSEVMCRSEQRNREGKTGYVCTRPADHDGLHVACHSASHEIAEWGNEDADEDTAICFQCGHDKPTCGAEHDGWCCTKVAGHDGPHVACGSKHCIAIWHEDRDAIQGPTTPPTSEGEVEMSQALKKGKVDVVKVERHAGQLLVPETLSIDAAIKLLQEHKAHLEQEIVMERTFDTFPWDGAHALQRAFTEIYGWVPAKAVPGFFGDKPPTTISIETALGITEQVPWGRFGLPGCEGGWLQCTTGAKDSRMVFKLVASVRRKFEPDVERVFAELTRQIAERSIYRGKAVRIRFLADNGTRLELPEVKFIPTDVERQHLILSRETEAAVETSLLTPIERAEECERNGIAIKRGVLLGGPYGTGKTLAAGVAANVATTHGITYIYCPRADELKDAIAFARQYESPAAVVFCEDIDRVMAGERSVEMDDLLNIVDGIDGKRSRIIVVLTTNHLENINQAMLRPGRLDAVIDIGPPDAEAVERLLRACSGGAILPDEDLTEVGKELAGEVPAVLTEVVKRSKLAQLRRTPRGERISTISAEALLESARTMTRQLKLLKPREAEKVPALDSAFAALVRKATNGDSPLAQNLDAVHKLVNEVHEAVI